VILSSRKDIKSLILGGLIMKLISQGALPLHCASAEQTPLAHITYRQPFTLQACLNATQPQESWTWKDGEDLLRTFQGSGSKPRFRASDC
jgi:hypothetical protein